jgi:hypothetical protein
MRIVYPTITNMGLGNNLITVAKAHLIAESCQMNYQTPIWSQNIHVWPPTNNGYGHYFPSTTVDRIRLGLFSYQQRIQNKLSIRIWPPVLSFRRQDYFRTQVVDMGEASQAYLKTIGLDDPSKSVVLTTSGMWGGYISILRARRWLRNLLMSHVDTRRRYEELQGRTEGRLRVAVNIKLGSYAPHPGKFEEGERIVRLPLDWYTRICKQIREVCDCAFVLVTDGTQEELEPFLNEIQPVHYLGQPYTDLLGLLLLIHSDLVICSNSTYSRLGCFLNDKPYVWIGDTLIKDDSGRFGYLWRDSGVPVPPRPKPPLDPSKGDPAAVRRCFALPYEFQNIPQGLKRYLSSDGRLPIEITDDLLYGGPVHLM